MGRGGGVGGRGPGGGGRGGAVDACQSYGLRDGWVILRCGLDQGHHLLRADHEGDRFESHPGFRGQFIRWGQGGGGEGDPIPGAGSIGESQFSDVGPTCSRDMKEPVPGFRVHVLHQQGGGSNRAVVDAEHEMAQRRCAVELGELGVGQVPVGIDPSGVASHEEESSGAVGGGKGPGRIPVGRHRRGGAEDKAVAGPAHGSRRGGVAFGEDRGRGGLWRCGARCRRGRRDRHGRGRGDLPCGGWSGLGLG
jgi:hypothetical protein